MIFPDIKEPDRYVGLYAVDFGDHSQAGLTAEQVAELLDSDASADLRIYKIYKAYPDGRLELTGVRREVFQMEAGMFFYARQEQAAREDFDRLCRMAEASLPPGRAKVHLASDNNGGFVTALIYPAEYDDQFSRWLLDVGYRTHGVVEAGVDAVNRYYDQAWHIVQRKQLWASDAVRLLNSSATEKAVRKVGR